MNCLFLYNPNSGKGAIKRKLAYIEKRLRTKYETADIVATESAQDLERRVHDGAEKYDLIVFSGGDGTFNNVLQGLGERDVRLGYLPSGTANDVARSLGIPRSVRGALDVILNGRCERLDCMRINGTHYAMYVAAAGSLTCVTYQTPQSQKRALGWFAYLFRGLAKNMKLEVFPLVGECGENRFETDGVLAFVLNGRSLAGFPVNKAASMQDGTLELVLIKQAKRPNLFQKIGAYLSLAAFMVVGVKVRKKDIDIMRGDHVRIHTDRELVWDFDGEKGTAGDIDVEVVRGRVQIFVPKNKRV